MMNKTTASLLAGAMALSGASLGAQTFVDVSNPLFADNFSGYAPGDLPAYVTPGILNPPAVAADASDWFGEGTSNQFLQYRKVGHNTLMADFLANPTPVAHVGFDFITRVLPADETYAADGRWINIQFYSDNSSRTDGPLLNNNFRAHITSLRLTNTTIRSNAIGNPSYGAIDELVHFDLYFNNTTEDVEHTGPNGLPATLAAGTSSVWVSGSVLVASYNESRTAGTLGTDITGIGIVADSAAVVSFDLDNWETYGVIPEPSTYALIFGGLALAGAFYVRRRRS